MFAISRRAWSRLTSAFLRTDRTRALFRESASVLVLRVGAHALRLPLGILLANVLGAPGYGVFAYASTWLAILQMLAVFGLDQMLVRFVAAYRTTAAWSALKGLLRFGITTAVACTVLVGAAATIIINVAEIEPQLRSTLLIMLATLPVIVAALIRQSVVRGMDRASLAQVPENLLYPTAFILLLLAVRFGAFGSSQISPPTAAVFNGVAWSISLVASAVISMRVLPKQLAGAPAASDTRVWARTLPPLVASVAAYYVFSRADILILGAFAPSRDVGIYAVAWRGSELMAFGYEAMTLAGTSLFAGIFATGDQVELQRFTNLVTKTIFGVGLIGYPLLFLFTPEILGLFGDDFVAGSRVMRLLLTTYFISTFGGFVMQMLYVTGNERSVAPIVAASAILNVVLSLVLVPTFGMMGAAVASGASLIVMKGALVYILYKRVGILALPFGRPPAKRPSPG